jgi:hypothetical protein
MRRAFELDYTYYIHLYYCPVLCVIAHMHSASQIKYTRASPRMHIRHGHGHGHGPIIIYHQL